MNTTALIGILVIIVVAAAGAAIMMHGGGETTTTTAATTSGGGAGQTTTGQGGGATSTTSGQGTTTQGGAESLDISGTWEGTFTTHKMGTGHFRWIIKEKTDGKYEGLLITWDAYPLECYIPITVTVSGNKITLGTVGSTMPGFGAVTFTGTITGDGSHAEGTWQFATPVDSGTWSGSKVSSSTSTPTNTCPGETTTETETTTTSSEEASTTTSTQEGGSTWQCTPTPPQNYEDAFNQVYQAISEVFGQDNLECYGQETVNTAYTVEFNILNHTQSEAITAYKNLANAFQSRNWQVLMSSYQGYSMSFFFVINSTYNGDTIPVAVLIQIDYEYLEPSLTLTIQPPSG